MKGGAFCSWIWSIRLSMLIESLPFSYPKKYPKSRLIREHSTGYLTTLKKIKQRSLPATWNWFATTLRITLQTITSNRRIHSDWGCRWINTSECTTEMAFKPRFSITYKSCHDPNMKKNIQTERKIKPNMHSFCFQCVKMYSIVIFSFTFLQFSIFVKKIKIAQYM